MEEPSLSLDGKVVLVTGGSRGLGRAMSLGFARAGADVIVASRKLEPCQELAAEIERTTGRKAYPIAAHVGEWDQCDALFDPALKAVGKVDVLVNNAGMSPLYERPSDVTEALFDKVIDVNLRGPFRLTALFGEHMIANGGGAVINVSSMSGVNPDPAVIPYGAAKAGVNSMTLSFARAYGPNVRVNCIMVGRFRTDVSKAWDMAAVEAEVAHYALRRIGEPEEVVGTALYLASDASRYTTGAVIRVDGGTPY
jgi:NAD(P)-dependent dehydrogenase (short-subunit alcohol dehydrogenase family)